MIKKQYWFRRKRYGYGWTPDTWQGWLATAMFIVLVVAFSVTLENSTLGQFVFTLLFLLVVTMAFIMVVYEKGENL